MLRRAATRVMSCDASVVVDGDPALLESAVRRLHDLERRWSRFRPDSEVSRLNAAAGRPLHVGEDTIHLVEALVAAWHATDGAFDPTLLGALVGLGYVASREDAELRTSLPAGTRPRGEPGAVLVDPERRLVRVPLGTTLDPGGLGKGLAADLVVEELLADGAVGALVEVGGDLRCGGTPPLPTGWTVAVSDPVIGPSVHVAMAAGAAATSTTALRRWPSGCVGHEHHHLVDPRTLRPCVAPTVSCTVLAGTASWAEAFTKPAFVLGWPDAGAMYERHGLAVRAVTADGSVVTTSAWRRFELEVGRR